MNKLLLPLLLATTLTTLTAHAEEVPTSTATPSQPPLASPTDLAHESDDYEAIKLRVPWTGDAGSSIAFSYESGSWGGEWMQGIRTQVPLGRHFGVTLRGLMLGELKTERWDLGVRLDLTGRSPVFLNLVRLYGGGGLQLFRPITGPTTRKTSLGGGGHFGFEFFMSEWMAWILEVGGNSGSQDSLGSGATIVAGVSFYPF